MSAPEQQPPRPGFTTEAAASAWMTEHHPLEAGWIWTAHPYGPAGWYALAATDPAGRPPFGGRTLLGPGPTVLTLSSNPFIHGFAETLEVLHELGDEGLSSDALADAVRHRTATRRDRS